jgi:CheY-like chemotaxis protein
VKTLIVEDDFTARLVLQKALARYGDCHVAVNGKEAVDAFRELYDAYVVKPVDVATLLSYLKAFRLV